MRALTETNFSSISPFPPPQGLQAQTQRVGRGVKTKDTALAGGAIQGSGHLRGYRTTNGVSRWGGPFHRGQCTGCSPALPPQYPFSPTVTREAGSNLQPSLLEHKKWSYLRVHNMMMEVEKEKKNSIRRIPIKVVKAPIHIRTAALRASIQHLIYSSGNWLEQVPPSPLREEKATSHRAGQRQSQDPSQGWDFNPILLPISEEKGRMRGGCSSR